MKKHCTLCDELTDDLYLVAEHYVLSIIKEEHPEWVEQDGACKKCLEHYQALDKAIRLIS